MDSQANGKDLEARFSRAAASLLLVGWLIKVAAIQVAAAGNRWMTGDWLIDYSAGFVRRGLIGEFARWAQGAFQIGPVPFVVGLKIILYTAFSAAVLFLLRRRKDFGALEAILLLSPALLPFDLYDSGGSGRKEILLLAVFAAYLLLSRPGEPGPKAFFSRAESWCMALAFPTLTLVHEGLAFFLPFFLLHALIRRRPSGFGELLPFAIPFSLSLALLPVLYFFFRGDVVLASQVCRDLMARGVPETLCSGGIEALGGYEFRIDQGMWANYLPTMALTALPLLGYGRLAYPGTPWARTMGLVLASCLPTLPLYWMGADWGRWIHVSAMLTFLVLLANRPAGRLPWHGVSRRYALLFGILAWMFLFHWKLPHYVPAGSGPVWFREDYGRMGEALRRF